MKWLGEGTGEGTRPRGGKKGVGETEAEGERKNCQKVGWAAGGDLLVPLERCWAEPALGEKLSSPRLEALEVESRGCGPWNPSTPPSHPRPVRSWRQSGPSELGSRQSYSSIPGAPRRPRLWSQPQQLQLGYLCPSMSRGATRRGHLGLPGWPWLLVPAWFLIFSGLALYYLLAQPSAPSWGPPPSPAPSPSVTVLMWWNPFHGSRRFQKPAPDCLRLFNLSGCRLLTDRRDYWQAQAVVFHHRDLVWNRDWPPPASEPQRGLGTPGAGAASPTVTASRPARPPGQRWVWMNFESPSNSPRLESLDGSLFNWTLSYRADSDIFVPYGYLYPRTSPHDQPSRTAPSLDGKKGLVAWVVSNWNERQARVRYYRELSRHLQVDVYGQCGPAKQPVPDVGLLPTVARYKFYLAFENSQHPDYITEKLWRNSLLAGAVPVVLGPSRDNYERFVPPDAFIHVDDFPDAGTLATYLRFLDRNPKAYGRYFEWRRHYAVHFYSFWAEPWCRTCQALQNAGDQPKKLNNLAAWFKKRETSARSGMD